MEKSVHLEALNSLQMNWLAIAAVSLGSHLNQHLPTPQETPPSTCSTVHARELESGLYTN